MTHRSYFADQTLLSRRTLRPAPSGRSFASIVGQTPSQQQKVITGPNGEHLQFPVAVHAGIHYQVDVNIQSRDGSPIQLFTTSETLHTSDDAGEGSFGPMVFGVFANAALSYRQLGLADKDFQDIEATLLQQRLEDALNGASFVAVYGQTFDDGGPTGRGLHDTHFAPRRPNQDGAIAIYTGNQAGVQPQRTWFFFKFETDSIG